MKDENKSKKQLIDELVSLRQQVAELKTLESERKRAKDQILMANERLQYLLSSTSAVIYTAESSGDYGATFISKNVTRMTGYEPRKLLEKPSFWIDHVHPDDVERILSELANIFEQERYAYEYRFRCKDGTYIWMRDEMKLVRDEKGEPLEIIGYWIDITKRKRMEEALRQSEDRYKRLLKSVTDYIYTVKIENGQPVATSHSPGCEAVTGYTPAEYEADPHLWYRMIYPEDQQAVIDQANKLISGEVMSPLEHRIIHKDGSIRWVRNTPVPRHDEKGYLVAYDGLITDVTARKQAEEALRRERDKAQQYLDIAEVILVALNEKGDITLINRKGQRILGYEDGDLLGKNWFDICLPAQIREDVKTIFDRLMARDIEPVEYYENPVLTKSGEERMIAWHNIVLTDEAGNVAGSLSSGEDITERKRAEEEKEKLQAQLLQAQKMEAVGRLTGGIAHDFNNLLTAISGFAELAQRRLSPDSPLREMMGYILDAGQRAANLVRQLLAFSSKQIIAPKILDLNVLVVDLGKMLQRIIGEDIQIETILAPNLWSVKVDPAQIEQIVVNLAVNARDAMPDGGKLTIETANVVLADNDVADHPEVQPGQYILLTVSDTGIGVSETMQAHLFEPFFTTKEQGKGSGLGLATVYGIVKQNRGDIRLYSEEGQGTTFKIYLPRVEGSAQPLPRSGKEEEIPGGSETILLVEDNAEVRELARQVLAEQGYKVLETEDSEDALRLATHYPASIHLLLTDVVMPGMSGKTLAERLVPIRPNLKIIFISGYTDETVMHHGVLEPGVAFLQKPFSPMDLLREVRAMLDAPPQ